MCIITCVMTCEHTIDSYGRYWLWAIEAPSTNFGEWQVRIPSLSSDSLQVKFPKQKENTRNNDS